MAHRNPPDSGTASLVESYPHPPGRTTLDAIASIPEEHVWLASRKSPRTRRAYRQDVEHFMRTIGIRSVDELRGMDHRAVPAWEAYMREVELAEASTIRCRLAALSSLSRHLIKPGAADFANLNSSFLLHTIQAGTSVDPIPGPRWELQSFEGTYHLSPILSRISAVTPIVIASRRS